MITTITSSQDPRLDPLRLGERQLTTIAQRRSTLAAGRFIAEGDLVVARALAAGYKPEVVLCDSEQANRFATDITTLGGQCLTADVDIRRDATGLGVPLSALGVFCDTTSADPLSRRALRVSMGAAFNFQFARSNNIAETLQNLNQRGFAVLALTPNSLATDLSKVVLEPSKPRALVFGSERAGLSQLALEASDIQVRIEMNPAIDSLNVAAAAAIACYALR